MRKKINNPKLKSYSLAAGALLAASTSVNAQIHYKDIDPDETLSGPIDSVDIDINEDGVFDYRFYKYSYVSTSTVYRYGIVRPLNGNKFLGSYYSSSIIIPKDLAAGDNISSQAGPWAATGSATGYYSMGFLAFFSSYSGMQYGYGNFIGKNDKFLGLRFTINNNTHYGWIRLDIPSDASTVTLKDMAYNATPNDPILAGEDGVGIKSPDEQQLKIGPNPTEGLFQINCEKAYHMRITDLSGQLIMEKAINSGSHQFDLSYQPSGIYLIQLQNSKEQITQKIILQ